MTSSGRLERRNTNLDKPNTPMSARRFSSPRLAELRHAVEGWFLSPSSKTLNARVFSQKEDPNQDEDLEETARQTARVATDQFTQNSQTRTSASKAKFKSLVHRCKIFKENHKRLVNISMVATLALAAAFCWQNYL